MKPEETFGHKFRIINNMIHKYMDAGREREEDPVSRMQGGVIHYLFERQERDIFQKEIEEVFHISGATASNMLKSMEKNGFIERVAIPRDGRLKKIVLTPKAICKDACAKRNIERMESCITSGMSAEEVEALSRRLDAIIQNIAGLPEP